jgi:hypothetical protein
MLGFGFRDVLEMVRLAICADSGLFVQINERSWECSLSLFQQQSACRASRWGFVQNCATSNELVIERTNMGIQREPGQKGVSWSNIAVGTSATLALC